MDDGGSSVRSARNCSAGCGLRREELELLEVARARRRGVVLPGDHGLEERPQPRQLTGGRKRVGIEAVTERRAELPDAGRRPLRHGERLVEEASQGRRRVLVVRPSHLEVVHQASCGRRTHPLEELEDSEPAHLVEGVLEDPEERERVLHVRRLHELQAAVLHERDVASRELDLEVVRVMGRPEQHRLRLQCDPFLPMREHRPADDVALLRFVETRAEHGKRLALARGSERLLVPLRAEGDHRVRRHQDRRRRSVVPFELDDRRAREAFGELQDVLHGGGAEPVDRLGVVADDREVPRTVRRPHPLEDVGLQRVGVLVLVDEDVIEHRGELRCGGGRRRERLPEQQEVVVVEDVLAALAFGVGAEDVSDPLGLVEAPRIVAPQHVDEPLAGVHRPRVDRRERVLPWEPALA